MDLKYKSLLILAFLVVIYTLYTILLQIGGSTIGLIPQLFYAFLVGFIASLALSIAMDRGKGLVSIVRQPKMLLAILAIGIINNAVRQFFLGEGTLGTNPNIASIVYRSWVIIVALFTPLVLRQKVKKMQMFAILVGFLGLYIIVSSGTLFSLDYAETPYIGFVLISAGCSAFITLVMGKYNFNIYTATVLFNLASFVVLGMVAVATGTSLVISFPVSALFSVVFLGVVGFCIATNLYYYAVKTSGPQVVGNALLMIPFLTFMFSAVILNTPIEAYYIIAALFITLGAILQKHYSSAPERITSKSALGKTVVYDITGAFAGNKGTKIVNQIRGGNKALAIRLHKLPFDEKLHNKIFSRRNCMIFTTEAPHEEARPHEIKFVKSILGLKKGEVALIGMGNPNDLEDAFEEFTLKSQSTFE